jgi:hypothetical protein
VTSLVEIEMKSLWLRVAAAILATGAVVCPAPGASDGSTVTVESGVAPVAGQLPEGDVEALLTSLARAIDAGSKDFAVPPAVFRFARRSFVLKDVQDMEIDGQGSNFLFALRGGRVHLQSCQNVTLKNLVLDREHPPLTSRSSISPCRPRILDGAP